MSIATFSIGMTGAQLVAGLNSNQTLNITKRIGALSPSASAYTNVAALQAALDIGGFIVILDPGIYEMNTSLYINSKTHLYCAPGVIFKKVADYGSVIRNAGSVTRVYDEDITIEGLEIIVDGKTASVTDGMNGNLAFAYIRNLTMRNIRIADGDSTLFGIHIINFDTVKLYNLYLHGLKDALHFHCGHDAFVDGLDMAVTDDGIGIDGLEWNRLNAGISDTYNITIKNVKETYVPGAVGFSITSRVSTWEDWTSGHSYTYRQAALNSVGDLYQSDTGATTVATVEPTHKSGYHTGADGISWHYLDSDINFYSTDVYNITFEDCVFARSPMQAGTLIHAAGTEALGSYRNIKFINCVCQTDFDVMWINSYGNLKDITIRDCTMSKGVFYYGDNQFQANDHCDITIEGCHMTYDSVLVLTSKPTESVILKGGNNFYTGSPAYLAVGASGGALLRITDFDLPVLETSINNPVVGDIVRTSDGRKIYKAGGWVNMAV
jgi:hypothetical protein